MVYWLPLKIPYSPVGWSCRICQISLHSGKTPISNKCSGYDIKQSDGEASVLKFGECGVFFYYHYSQVYSVRVPPMNQIELFNLLFEIIISYSKLFSCVQVIHIRYEYLINRTTDILLRHCNAVYNQNPIDRWMKGCILPFPKKGDLGLAKNYRGITLTSVAAKIYNALLRNCIEPKIDNILRKNQNGF